MRCHTRWRMLAVFWLIVVILHPHAGFAQVDLQKKQMALICLTDRPAIVEGGTARLRAWAIAPDGTPIAKPVSFTWEVTEGTIQGSGSDVQWNLVSVGIKDGELRNQVTATVNAVATDVEDATCEVKVFIGTKDQDSKKRSHDGELLSARQYLLPNEKEKSGFGLYSYLLFRTKPKDEDQKAQYLKILEACLRLMETVEDQIAHHRLPRELNATHIPVKTDPKDSQVLAEWAANVLDVYNYTAARQLLDKLDKKCCEKDRPGPYFVSVRKDPLSNRSDHVQDCLVQDFTGKVPELISEIVELFIHRAAQQPTWTDDSKFRGFWLDLRNLVAITGGAAPEVVGRTMIMLNRANQLQ